MSNFDSDTIKFVIAHTLQTPGDYNTKTLPAAQITAT